MRRNVGLLLFSKRRNVILQKVHLLFSFARIFMVGNPLFIAFLKYRKLEFATYKTGVISNDMFDCPSDN